VGDTGFTTDCSADRVVTILKEQACQAGADVVYVTEWQAPDLSSTCYRATADLIRAQRPASSGTCFVVRPDGYILTNMHVIGDATSVQVELASGSVLMAKIYKADFANDIAVLRVSAATPDYLALSPSADANLGTEVFTIGYPVTALLGKEPKYTDGSISALSGAVGAANLMQISVPVQPGNSGGPLVDFSGRVIGIVTSTAAVREFLLTSGTLPQNVNWAVKAEYAQLLFDPPPSKNTATTRQKAIAQAQRSICRVDAK